MAMLPFCGYNMADYFAHWLEMGTRLVHPPKIYRVNWFRVNEQGQFIWPGFGENLLVLRWIIGRCDGQVEATETPIGYLPTVKALDGRDLDISGDGWRTLLGIDRTGWLEAARNQTDFFAKFGDRLPGALREEQRALIARLKSEQHRVAALNALG